MTTPTLSAFAAPRGDVSTLGAARRVLSLRRSGALALMTGVVLLAGCAMPSFPKIEPWVKPYERERLADPMMALSRDPLSDKHFEHTRDVREGSRGATGVQGGGCGCN